MQVRKYKEYFTGKNGKLISSYSFVILVVGNFDSIFNLLRGKLTQVKGNGSLLVCNTVMATTV